MHTAKENPTQSGSPRRASLMGHPAFFKLLLLILLLGHLADLAGAWLWPPTGSAARDPQLSLVASRRAYDSGWSTIIIGKAIVCLLCGLGARQFLLLRHRWYPARGGSFREFITGLFFGAPMSWLESLFRVPKLNVSFLAICLLGCWSGPYFLYLGYQYPAARYGWLWLGGAWWRGWWIDYGLLAWILPALGWVLYLLWDDYRSNP